MTTMDNTPFLRTGRTGGVEQKDESRGLEEGEEEEVGLRHSAVVNSELERMRLSDAMRRLSESRPSQLGLSGEAIGGMFGFEEEGGDERARTYQDEDEEVHDEQGECLTVRAVVVGCCIGGIVGAQNIYFVMKIGWTQGVSTTAAVLGFALMSALLSTPLARNNLPFGPKENTIMQTAAVAAASMSGGSGLASSLYSLTKEFQDYYGYDLSDKDRFYPDLQGKLLWCYAILLFGFFIAIPLRRLLIDDYQLPFPSGFATAHVIKAMHATRGATKAGMEQFWLMLKVFIPSAAWFTFKDFWMVNLDAMPIFGLEAFKFQWFCDFSTAFVATGFFTPLKVSVSWLAGSLLGWAIISPIVFRKDVANGNWYSCDDDVNGSSQSGACNDPYNVSGPYAYTLFPTISGMFINGIFELGKVMWKVYQDRQAQALLKKQGDRQDANPLVARLVPAEQEVSWLVWVPGLVATMIFGAWAGSYVFPHTSFVQLLVCSAIGPLGAVGILYGQGLTDIGMGTVFAKLAIIVCSLWSNSVVTAIVGGSLVWMCLAQAGDLMQDFKTAKLTSVPPNKMFVAQVIGAMTSPLWCVAGLWLFMHGQDLPSTKFPINAGNSWLGLAVLLEDNFSLPKYCWVFIMVFSVATVIVEICYIKYPKFSARWLPSTMPFFIGMYGQPLYAIDVMVGAIIRLVWRSKNLKSFEENYAVVGAGLVAGEGITALVLTTISAFSGYSGFMLVDYSYNDDDV